MCIYSAQFPCGKRWKNIRGPRVELQDGHTHQLREVRWEHVGHCVPRTFYER